MNACLQRFRAMLGAAGAALCLAAPLAAAAYPNGPVSIVVPYPPGGGTDALARAIGASLQTELGQSIVVENRPGAGGTIGAAYASRAKPDGQTLLMLNILPHTASSGLYKSLSFDPVKDFQGIGLIGATPYLVVVNPSVPAKTLGELVDYARQHPGKVNYGSSGYGGVSHLATELFLNQASVTMTHVPYKGDGPVATALIGGEIQVTFGNVMAMLPHVKSGALRALAVTGPQRLAILPDTPTVKESGYADYVVVGEFGLAAPKGTPAAVIERLNAALAKAAQAPALRKIFEAQGVTPRTVTAQTMQDMMVQQQRLWLKTISDVGITAQ